MYKSLIMLVVLLGAVLTTVIACSNSDDEPTPAVSQRASPPIPPAIVISNENSSSELASAQVIGGKSVLVDMNDNGGRGPFVYLPVDLTFEVGDVANFTLTSESQFHTFTVSDLGIDEGVDGGDTVDFNFTFEKQGTYSLVCIPHEALGMVGTITVR